MHFYTMVKVLACKEQEGHPSPKKVLAELLKGEAQHDGEVHAIIKPLLRSQGRRRRQWCRRRMRWQWQLRW